LPAIPVSSNLPPSPKSAFTLSNDDDMKFLVLALAEMEAPSEVLQPAT
jgi:hypothetical protein